MLLISYLTHLKILGRCRFGISVLAAALIALSSAAQEPFNPAALLRGSSPSVLVNSVTGSFGEDFSVLVRGGSGIRGSSQPLWVVDGVEITPSLSYLNIYDIESIRLERDLSVTSRYGNRGANGVVIVTTGAGRSDEKFRVKWNSDIGLSMSAMKVAGTAPGFNHNHYVSFLGSTGHSMYGVSGWFRQTDGVEPRDNGLAGGLRAFFENKANSVLTFGMNSTFVMGKSNTPACTEPFGSGSLTLLQRNPDFFPDQSVAGWKEDYDNERQDKRFTSGIFLAANIGKFVKFKLDTGVDLNNSDSFIWYGDRTPLGAEENGRSIVKGNTDFAYNAGAHLTFNRYFADKHHLIAELTADLRGANVKRGTMIGSDFFTHKLRARGLNLYNSDPNIRKYEYNTFSYGALLNLGYEYADMVGVSALLRIDHTPRYEKVPDLYKNGSAWVDLHKALFPDGKAVSTLRLSGSYGEAGLDNNVPYIGYVDYLTDNYPEVQENLQMFYEGFRHLRTREGTAKLELGFLSDRLTLSAAYFDRMTDDAFTSYCFGRQDGYYWVKAPRESHFSREARISMRGIEAEVKGVILKADKYSWSASAGFAWNIAQIVKVDDGDLHGPFIGGDFIATANVLGYSPSSFYGYKTDENGELIDVTGDGVVNRFDRQIIGGSMPKFYGSVGTSFTYGDFSFEMLATWAAGHQILELNKLLFEGAPDYDITDRYLRKGDYLRLSRARAEYSVPLKKQTVVKALKVSLSGYDLLTYSASGRWNPTVIGVDYGTCPSSAALLAGVSLTFGRK